MRIVIMGEPVAQGRPRFSTYGGVMRTIDPAKSRDYKQYVKLAAVQQMGDRQLMDGPLSLSVRVFRSIPASWSKSRTREALVGALRPTGRPDVDNYVKGIKDALRSVVWVDDSQVVGYHEPFGKWYSDKPRIEIEVRPVDPVQPTLLTIGSVI